MTAETRRREWTTGAGPRVALAVVAGWALLASGCGKDVDALLASEGQEARIRGLRLLGEADGRKALEQAGEMVGHPDEQTALEAVRIIGSLNVDGVAEVLVDRALADPRGPIRREAAIQLGRLRTDAAADAVRKLVRTDPDAYVRATAAGALGRLRNLNDVKLLMETAHAAHRAGEGLVEAAAVAAVEQIVDVEFQYSPAASRADRQSALKRMDWWAPLVVERRRADQAKND